MVESGEFRGKAPKEPLLSFFVFADSHYHKSLTYDGQKLAELILASVYVFGIRFASSKLYTNDNKTKEKREEACRLPLSFFLARLEARKLLTNLLESRRLQREKL